MRLSRHAHYAIRSVLDLAAQPRTTSAEIARRQGIPAAYMAKIVQDLGRAGIVRTHRGSHGGVELGRPASTLTLLDVVEAAEGPLALNLCIVNGDCPCEQPCPVRTALGRLHATVESNLRAVTILDLHRAARAQINAVP
jgi:Rrf2 family protein